MTQIGWNNQTNINIINNNESLYNTARRGGASQQPNVQPKDIYSNHVLNSTRYQARKQAKLILNNTNLNDLSIP